MIGKTPDGFFRLGPIWSGRTWSETRRSSASRPASTASKPAVVQHLHMIFPVAQIIA